MLKLLRVGDTKIFAIVDEEQFMKEMKVEGYVRLEEKAENDCVTNFGNRDEEWFGKIQKLKDEKRLELYRPTKPFTRTSISLRSIILCYFKEMKTTAYISVGRVCQLIAFIWSKLVYMEQSPLYIIDCDATKAGIEEIILHNNDVFYHDEEGFIVSKQNFEEICNCNELRLLDKTIAGIIKEFVKKCKKG